MKKQALTLITLITITSSAHAAPPKAPTSLHKAAQKTMPPPRSTPQKTAWVICQIFKNNCRQAVNIAYCESRLNRYARNGQYRGIFQLGATERKTYGHGKSIWAQTRAAKRLYNQRGWQPWSCKN